MASLRRRLRNELMALFPVLLAFSGPMPLPRRKRFVPVLCALLSLYLMVGGYLYLSKTTINEGSCIYVDINPSIQLVVDAQHHVTAVSAFNEEGSVLLQGENFVGMPVEGAVQKITCKAMRTGYIDVNGQDNAIVLTVINDNKFIKEDLRRSLSRTLYNYFSENVIYGVVLEGELVFSKALKQALQYGVEPGKMRLIEKVSHYAQMPISQLKDKSVKELIQLMLNHMPPCNTFQCGDDYQKRLALYDPIFDRHCKSLTPEKKAAFIDAFKEWKEEKEEQMIRHYAMADDLQE